MRSKVGTVAMAVGALVAGGISVAAAQGRGNPTQQQERARTEEMREITLTVKKVDTGKHKVTFEAQVSPEASVMREGRTLKIDQLREGDEVRASFDPTTREVVKVQVTRPVK